MYGREGVSCVPPALRERDLWACSGPGYLPAGEVSLLVLVIMAPVGLWYCLGLMCCDPFFCLGKCCGWSSLNNLASPHSCWLQTQTLPNPPSGPVNLTQASLSYGIIPPCTVHAVASPWSFKAAPRHLRTKAAKKLYPQIPCT